MADLTLTEVIIACELKWRYRDVDEARIMQIFGKQWRHYFRHPGYTCFSKPWLKTLYNAICPIIGIGSIDAWDATGTQLRISNNK